MEKPNYQEWQDIIGQIDDRLFEEICYRLLKKMNYENIKPRGGSSDGGRDIEGQKTRFEGDKKTKYTEKYWFECKCYKSTIPWKEISDKLHSANIEKINTFIILSNRGLSPQAQEKVNEFKKTSPVRVFEWCGFPFLDILFQHKDLCDMYFPGYEIPSIPPTESKEKHIIKATINIGKAFGLELEAKIDKKIELNEKNINEVISNGLRSINDSQLGIPTKDKAQLYSNIAMIFFQFGHLNDALTFIEKSIIIEKTTSNQINKAIILEKMDDIEESNELYCEILEKEPNNTIALNNYGHNLRRQYELREALEYFNKAIHNDPKYLTAIDNKANTLKDLKQFEEAIKFVNEQINEKSMTILQKTKIDVLIEALDLKEAFKLNEELLKLYPNDADLLNNRGVIYEHNAQYQHRKKYLEMAYEAFSITRKTDPKHIISMSNQIVCLINSGQYDDAESYINEVLTQNESEPLIYYNKAEIESIKGNKKTALKWINKALHKKNLEKFILTKSSILLKLRQYKDVEEQCNKILKNDPNNSRAMRLIAESLKKRHHPIKAKKLLIKAEECEQKYKSLLEE